MSRKVLFWWTLEYVDFIFGLNTCLKLSAVTGYSNSNPVARNFFKLRGKTITKHEQM